jgi:Uma2 family endonuclease
MREYWVIIPETKEIQVHILEKEGGEPAGHYVSRVHRDVEALDVSVLPGLRVDFAAIWAA